MKIAPRRIASAALALGLAACGGGGGDSNASASNPDLAASSPTATAQDMTCALPNFRDEALRLVNARRAAGASCGDHGNFAPAGPLTWSDALTQAAYAHSADMAAKDYFSHDGLDGSTPASRIDAAGYAWLAIGENIAAGPLDVQGVIDGFMASPGHCANIMTAGFEQIGMACAQNAGSHYGRYYTMDLAMPR
jgi:uncharacterized protein YkwD